MFAGNVGEAQDMESIMNAALLLKNNETVKFIIVGDGRKMPYVQDFIKEHHLQNIVFTVGRFPVEMMASFFDKADLLLVSLKDKPIFNLTVPAKVQAYMSVGKPILAMLNGEGADTIIEADCGFTVPASDVKALVKTIEKISKTDPELLKSKGKNGKIFFQKRFTLKSCIDNLEQILKQ